MADIYQMTVSPDFPAKRMPGWFIFNTWLQRMLDIRIHLELYSNFSHQHDAIAADRVDIIYANPYDAAMLVRSKGFLPIARPAGKSDECLIAVAEAAAFRQIEDLRPPCRVASTNDPDVNMVGMIMLEPADLDRDTIQMVNVNSYPLVAKALMCGEADVGFFLEESFAELSGIVRRDLRPLATSRIDDIVHVLLIGPRLSARREDFCRILVAMAKGTTDAVQGASMLDELGFSEWEIVSQEDTEFMIDLMEALKC
jgi:phosphonate transport system substrate-binding protein